jgi:hypothetical protein
MAGPILDSGAVCGLGESLATILPQVFVFSRGKEMTNNTESALNSHIVQQRRQSYGL